MRRPGEQPDDDKNIGPGGPAKERLKQFQEQRGLPEEDPGSAENEEKDDECPPDDSEDDKE